jgi:hypothetical protein
MGETRCSLTAYVACIIRAEIRLRPQIDTVISLSAPLPGNRDNKCLLGSAFGSGP